MRYVNGKIEEIPGIDPRRAAFYNAGWPLDNTLNNSNGRSTSNIRDGLVSKSDAFGAQMEFNLAGGVKLQDNFRWSKNSGHFVGIFPSDDVSAAPANTRFATGANAGSLYAGNRFTAVVFNTKVDDVGLTANDLKVSKVFDLGAGKLTATGGLYTSMQHLKLTWNFNQYSLSASDEGARLLDVPGLVNGSPAFGGCCMNFQDSKYRTTAPYAIVAYEAGALNLDASIRRDRNVATGSYYQTLTAFGGLADGTTYNLARPRLIDYHFGNTSYSLGANFRLGSDLALFARYSDGAAYNADRITFFNDPNLVNGSAAVIPKNQVRQFEGGAKWRSGGMSVFATLFAAKTDEINVDLTTNPIKVVKQKYDSKGLELEGAYRVGDFTLLGGITFTDAEVTASTNAATVGKTPKRQAKVVYQLTPAYSFGPATIGASIVGTSKSMDDSPAGPVSVELPAFVAVNAFVSYALTQNLTASITANNLFDTIGYTESNDGRGAARSINGRTVKATLRHTF